MINDPYVTRWLYANTLPMRDVRTPLRRIVAAVQDKFPGMPRPKIIKSLQWLDRYDVRNAVCFNLALLPLQSDTLIMGKMIHQLAFDEWMRQTFVFGGDARITKGTFYSMCPFMSHGRGLVSFWVKFHFVAVTDSYFIGLTLK